MITDASVKGLGGILEQNGLPVICSSRRLAKAEEGYSQTVLEALAIHWAIEKLHKFEFNVKFKIVILNKPKTGIWVTYRGGDCLRLS